MYYHLEVMNSVKKTCWKMSPFQSPLKVESFLKTPETVLLYDPQMHHLKAFRSHLQGLAL